MKSKEDVLEIIANAKENGATLTEIAGTRSKKGREYIKEILEELINDKLIVKKNKSRFVLPQYKKTKKKTVKNYVTREELEGIVNEIYKDLAKLNDKIDRAFEYIDEVFLQMKKEKKSVSKLPDREEMLIAYDNVNRKENAGDSVPIPDFKRELRRMGFTFTDQEINELLLNLDKAEIIYLQQANDPETLEEKDKGIKTERGILFYITWIKRS